MVFNFNAHDMVAGAKEITQEVVVPAGLISLRLEGTIRPQDLTNPSIQCEGGYERLINGAWQKDMAWTFIGGPGVTEQPYLSLSSNNLAEMAGMTVRGYLMAITAGRYGWTARIE